MRKWASTVRLYLLGLVPLFAGLWGGLKLYGKLDDNAFRKVILNAVAWTAKVEVPKDGIEAKFYTHDDINMILGAYPAARKP